MEKVDRVKEWKNFSDYMISYLEGPKGKYGENKQGTDLMPFTSVDSCIYSVLKYAVRLFNGHGKELDFEKIAHYAQIAWTKNKKAKEAAELF